METYKGISFPFRFNSRGGVTTSELTPQDFSRIYDSIRQIVFTKKNERVMMTGFGTEAGDYVFEALEDPTEQGIFKHELTKAIEEYEDRVGVDQVNIFFDDEQGESAVIVEIQATIIKFMKSTTLRFRI